MKTLSLALLVALGLAVPAQAHQIWIEQPDQGTAVIRFGEFGGNLRETSPGLLDKLVKPAGTLLYATGERSADAVKTALGFALPFTAASGESIVAEETQYPLYTTGEGAKQTRNWYRPAARLVTGVAEQQPRLVLDLVPAGRPGEFRLFFKGEPRAKTKVTLVTQSGWGREAYTDEQGFVAFPLPWKGTYVAEVSVDDPTPGQRPGVDGPEAYDAVHHVTSLTYVHGAGLPPIPAGPAAPPNT